MTTPSLFYQFFTRHAQVDAVVDVATVVKLMMRDGFIFFFCVVGFAATDIAKVCGGRVEFVFVDFLEDRMRICYGIVPGFFLPRLADFARVFLTVK
jgi:hypothetical protein